MSAARGLFLAGRICLLCFFRVAELKSLIEVDGVQPGRVIPYGYSCVA